MKTKGKHFNQVGIQYYFDNTVLPKTLFFLAVFVLSIPKVVFCQSNLIPNPGFEEYYTCDYIPSGTPLQNTIPGWSKILYSPFYANHICYLDPTSKIHEEPYLAPTPFGNAYMLMIFRENAGVSFLPLRSYMQCRLLDTLYPDKDYYISYYVSNPRLDNSPTVSHWGLHFSDNYIVEQNTGIQFGLLKRNPQIEIDTVPVITHGIWDKYENCFRPDSVWTVMTVGHFRENSETKGIENLMHSRAFLLYDNFFLAEIENEVLLQTDKDTICVGECVTMSSNHSMIPGTFTWNLPGSLHEFASDSVVTVCYDEPGTYTVSLAVEHCTGRYEGVFEQAITVLPALSYQKPADQLICYGDSISVEVQTPHDWFWTDEVSSGNRYITEPGTYRYIVDNGFCSITDSFMVDYYFIPTEVNEVIFTCPDTSAVFLDSVLLEPGFYEWTTPSLQGCDSIFYTIEYRHRALTPLVVEGGSGFCLGDSVILSIISDHVDIFWEDGTQQKIRSIKEPGNYSVRGRDKNSCINTRNFSIVEYPLPEVMTSDLLNVWYEPGLALPVSYTGDIQHFVWSGGKALNCDDCPFPRLVQPLEGIYQINITDDNGCSNGSSLRVSFVKVFTSLPNIIRKSSPENATFFLTSDPVINYDLRIYDRWGNLVFRSDMAISNEVDSGWQPSAEYVSGVYVFLISYQELGQVKYISGDITVLD
jgi:hypothetical protein